MTAADQMLDRIVAWGRCDDRIRGLVLVGSRIEGRSDPLSDLDVQVYASHPEPYLNDKRWLSQFAPVWVCIPDEYRDREIRVPTRLVIFDQAVKVDFAFYPAAAITQLGSAGRRFRVLLDKDASAKAAATSDDMAPMKLGESEFIRAVEEFWFEAYHVAKYLSRGELWLAKTRDYATKQLLLRMLIWDAQLRGRWSEGADEEGRNLHSWVQRETLDDLHRAFGRFDAADTWAGLNVTTDLFRRIAIDLARSLNFVYPFEVDRNIAAFIAKLESKAE